MALKYYDEEYKLWPDLGEVFVPHTLAPHYSQQLLERIGYRGRVQYLLKPNGGWHHCERLNRGYIIHYSGPDVSLRDIIHEVAHLWAWEHDINHRMLMALLAIIVKEKQ